MTPKKSQKSKDDIYKDILKLQRFHQNSIVTFRLVEVRDTGDILVSMNEYNKISGENSSITMRFTVEELTLLEKVFSGLADKRVSRMIFEL